MRVRGEKLSAGRREKSRRATNSFSTVLLAVSIDAAWFWDQGTPISHKAGRKGEPTGGDLRDLFVVPMNSQNAQFLPASQARSHHSAATFRPDCASAARTTARVLGRLDGLTLIESIPRPVRKLAISG
jgi:hypothetical protein